MDHDAGAETTARGGHVAIIGMACRVAGADNSAELFQSLSDRRDCRVPITRFNGAGYYSKDGGPRKGLTNVQHAYFVNGDVSRFDNEAFNISPNEARAIDPQQRLLLEVAYESIENAGIPLERMRGTDTAVYTGLFVSDYSASLLRDIDCTPKYFSTGASTALGANRLSYFFDIHGPSLVVDSACSSTLVALHHAINTLQSEESGMALVCGANLIINPDMFVHMSELGFLSPDGICHSFDAAANGYARGEGVVSLLLKPLDAALRDGDAVRAVIRGCSVNQDGRTNGLTYPSEQAQTANMRKLYQKIGINPGDVSYVEAHATGTSAGDPVEMAALRSIFVDQTEREEDLIVGSIKSNIGHLEAAAGLAGIVKTVECLEREQVPPQLHFANPNPRIDFDRMKVPTASTLLPQIQSRPLLAAVNSFGFGGTNGHVVLQRHSVPDGCFKSSENEPRKLLFKFSAVSELALRQVMTNVATYIEETKPSLSDLAFTLLARRSTLAKTTFLTASSHGELCEKLRSAEMPLLKVGPALQGPLKNIGFVFTGQGAQWAGMGQELLSTSSIFSETIDRCDDVLSRLSDPPGWTVRSELSKDRATSRINTSTISQPVCTMLQLGLVEVWSAWGLHPDFTVGHSSGEVAAAYAAGLISLERAVAVAYYRGRHMGVDNSQSVQSVPGAMCAIGASEQVSRKMVDRHAGKIALAAVNSPSSCTLSGDMGAIDDIVQHCKEQGTFCRKLRVDTAYHSHHMLPKAAKYRQSLTETATSHKETIPRHSCKMFSSVFGREISSEDLDDEYWVTNMTSTVQFCAGVKAAAIAMPIHALVEVGPHPALKGPTCDTLAELDGAEVPYFGSCSRGVADLDSILDTVAELHMLSMPMAFDMVNAARPSSPETFKTPRLLTDLPPYPWDRRFSFWSETRISRNQRFRKYPRHELLGARVMHDNDLNMTWRNLLTFRELSWLRSLHQNGINYFPVFLYILMVLEAAEQMRLEGLFTKGDVQIRNMRFPEQLLLDVLEAEDQSIETHFSIHRSKDLHQFSFSMTAQHADAFGDGSLTCCSGEVDATAALNPGNTSDCHRSMATHSRPSLEGLKLDPSIANLRSEYGMISGTIDRQDEDGEDHSQYILDPYILASLASMHESLVRSSNPSSSFRCTSIDYIDISSSDCKIRKGTFEVRSTPIGGGSHSGRVRVSSQSGSLVFRDVMVHTEQLVTSNPPENPLFFTPRILPDITLAKHPLRLTMTELFERTFHKWPTCDIGLTKSFADVCAVLEGMLHRDSQSFRSIQVVSLDEKPTFGDKVRVVGEFSDNSKFRLLFTTEERLASNLAVLEPTGMVCVQCHGRQNALAGVENLEPIGHILKHGEPAWVLAQKVASPSKPDPDDEKQPTGTIISSGFHVSQEYSKQGIAAIRTTANIRPDQVAVGELSLTHLIILDFGERSLLTQESGSVLLSLLQDSMEDMKTLLWVTQKHGADPHHSTATAFLRSLESEHPALRSCSLVIEGTNNEDDVARTVTDVFRRLESGLQESLVHFKDDELSILRYIPDHRLCSSAGAAPPRLTSSAPEAGSLEVDVSARRAACLSVQRFTPSPNLEPGMVETSVCASLIDLTDVQLFQAGASDSRFHIGHFFAGQRMRQPSAQESFVVGWTDGAHKPTAVVSEQELVPLPSGMDVFKALSFFATACIADCVLEDIIRVREDDVLRVDFFEGPLSTALLEKCQTRGIKTTTSRSGADFDVSYSLERGLLVNGKSVVPKLHVAIKRRLQKQNSFSGSLSIAPFMVWDLRDCQNAYEASSTTPLINILTYESADLARKSIVRSSTSSNLFRSDGCYIIIGGIGGLSQTLCRWMIERGARSLVSISRRGKDAAGAGESKSELEKLGARVSLLKGDACDFESLSRALDGVRKTSKIFGCFNLAMVLDNTPFTKMTAAQWDRVVRTKVDSTWNLHKATRPDELEFFIMMSSVAAITGNRTQSNYAVGNAFQNSMAEYRRSLGLPGVAVALGAIRDIGTLAHDTDHLSRLHNSGMRMLSPDEFLITMEAAVIESQHFDRPLIGTGLQSFKSINGVIQCDAGQTQMFWTQSTEFQSLLDHHLDDTKTAKELSLIEQIGEMGPAEAHKLALDAFFVALGSVLGYDVGDIDASKSLTSYGLDSLNAVACRFWFSKQLNVDIPLFEILASPSINDLVARVLSEFATTSSAQDDPAPTRHTDLPMERPTSHAQRRVWFLDQFVSDKTLHNLLLLCKTSGHVDVQVFKNTWDHFIARHEVLHSRFVNSAQGLRYVPTANPRFRFHEISTNDEDFDKTLTSVTNDARLYEFDLSQGILLHGWLVRSPSRSSFLLASHHIAWDRTSGPLVFNEIKSIYRALVRGDDPRRELPAPKFQYADYAIWQDELFQKGALNPHLKYWKDQLADCPSSVSLLPFSRTSERPEVKRYDCESVRIELPPTQASAMRDFCKRLTLTPSMLMTATVIALVNILTGDEDVLVGIFDGDRGHQDVEDLIGFAVNMLPIRVRLDNTTTFKSLLESLRKVSLEAYEHRAVPFDLLLQNLDITRNTSHSPLFQIVVNYQNQGYFPEQDFETFKMFDFEHYNARSQADMSFDIEEMLSGAMSCEVTYDTALYGRQDMGQFAAMIGTFLESALQNEAGCEVSSVDVVPPAARSLVASNLRPSHANGVTKRATESTIVPGSFQQVVREHSDHPAVLDGEQSMTYQELDRRSNMVANALLGQGLKKGDFVMVPSKPCVDMIVSVHGILKSGAAYVPVDPEYPPDRIASMAEDASVKFAILIKPSNALKNKLLACGLASENLLALESLRENEQTVKPPTLATPVSLSDVCCAMFTSGSTGKPKGVPIRHQQLSLSLRAYHNFAGSAHSNRFLLASSLVFDASFLTIFGAVLYGATLVVPSREAMLAPPMMVDVILTESVSHTVMTPTQMRALVGAKNGRTLSKWSSLRTLVLAGEALSPMLVKDLVGLGLPSSAFIQGYGPTETTMGNSFRRLTPEDPLCTSIALAPPLAPAVFYIVDGRGREVPPGTPGELLIGGPIVNSGYLNRDDATKRAFVSETLGHQGLLYRTGDLCRLRFDGLIDFLGRVGGDRQVKIRGIRTELSEVETVIYEALRPSGQRDSTAQVAVVFHSSHDGLGGVLAAYVAPTDYSEDKSAAYDSCRVSVQEAIRTSLPAHMMPGAIAFVPSLPMTASGKLDYKSITAWTPPQRASNGVGSPNVNGHSNLSAMEASVATIWAQLLDRDASFSPSDDFFTSGGHSLVLIQVQDAIKQEHGVTVSLADMFAHPSLGGMATLIEKAHQIKTATRELHEQQATRTQHTHKRELLEEETINWATETDLSSTFTKTMQSRTIAHPPKTIAVLGATTMVGAYFVAHMLSTSSVHIYTLATPGSTDAEAHSAVIKALADWNLLSTIDTSQLSRVTALHGALSHPKLNLTEQNIDQLNAHVDAFYFLASEVSLLKRYAALRAGNVSSVRFVISLAGSDASRPKPIYYLSTWGVSHLQSYHSTSSSSSPKHITAPIPLDTLTPSSNPTAAPGYLSARWAAEQLLGHAARLGIPVSVFRGSMCGAGRGRALPRDDVNRRILAACLSTGCVPDVAPQAGSGMAWVSAEYMARSVAVLAERDGDVVAGVHAATNGGAATASEPRVHHVVAPQHIAYRQLPSLLAELTHDRQPLRLVPPEEWSAAVRGLGSADAAMHAALVESWVEAGWAPFEVDCAETVAALAGEGVEAPRVDAQWLWECVIGERGL